MNILYLDFEISGHHLEYLHHCYIGASNDLYNNYTFCIPNKFQSECDIFCWPHCPNINFRFLNDKDLEFLKNSQTPLKKSFYAFKHLLNTIKECNAEKVILPVLIQFTPFLSILPLFCKTRIRGILYKTINPNKKAIRIRDFFNYLNFSILSKSSSIEKVFVLNDKKRVELINERYSTNKFKYLPDPVPQVDMSKVNNIRQQLDISTNDRVFLLFGAMSERKGVFETLQAITDSSREILKDCVFIFAGEMAVSTRDKYYSYINKAKDKARIIVYDKFCDYALLYNLCYSCDVILMPYKVTDLSSGVIGYASVFNKPVIGPKDGLIGRLIQTYNLGQTLPYITSESVQSAIVSFKPYSINSIYSSDNTVDRFLKILMYDEK